MAEEVTEHFFRYTDPNKAVQVRLESLERRVSEIERALTNVGTEPAEVNQDFQGWVKNELKAMKARMGRLRLSDG